MPRKLGNPERQRWLEIDHMETQETTPLFGQMILWARMGGYSTMIIFVLSVIITTLAFMKRALVVGYTFLLISVIMIAYFLLFRSANSQLAVHVAQLGKVLPYLLILWMLTKAKNEQFSQQGH
jgi:hypothetical protein